MRIRALSATFAVLVTSLVGIGLGSAPAQAVAPSNDLVENATPITGVSGSIEGTTADATWTVSEPTGTVQSGDPEFTRSVWYRITAPDDAGITFSTPYGRDGISIGTFYAYGSAAPEVNSDRYSANGWSVRTGHATSETVASVASTFVTDYSHDDPPGDVTYYVRVKTTDAGVGAFTLNWREGGLPTTTTATVTADHVAKTFQVDPSTSCQKTFFTDPPPEPVNEPAYTGYYIVRDENGNVVQGAKRRWNFYDYNGTVQPADIKDLPLLPGSHTYTVRFYEGTATLYCKRSEATFTLVDAQPTTTTLKAAVSKQKITFTGSVTPAPPQGASIQVREGTKSVAGLVLSSGAGKYTLSGVKPGKHTFKGMFESPFPAFASSTSKAVTVTVPKYTTITKLTAPKTAKVGARPTVKVKVLVGKALAKGSVVVRVNGVKVKTVKLVKGIASVKLPKLKKGKATVTATYVSTTVNASSKASRVITVTK